MSKLWFKQRTYGWGWEPASWQGWLIVNSYVILTGIYPLFCFFNKIELNVIVFSSIIALLTFGLIIICFIKGEKPQWRWGNKENKK